MTPRNFPRTKAMQALKRKSWWGEFSVKLGWHWVSNALPNALLFVLSVFFRKILILQLVGLVLTYNFSNCDFNKIRVEYDQIIFSDLKKYMNGTKSTQFNYNISCNNPPDCLTEIQRVTFSPTHGCTSLHKEMFAVKTKATLTLQCPGYSGIQINNTQAKKNRKKREVTTNKCLKQASQLLGLWRRFSRIKGNKRNHLNYSHISKHQSKSSSLSR
ncbi:PREDICTED: thymic stromal lymphopoietin [Galeopterus variegatus]|uniref:Thymic stromal lymphopoietin n=1 Tax=Galeopterus variegatus TaxID=482537 RepID=A0ABM0RUK5_GALVR|nr:PREDICTED: thymic stromal lymphopoietin [Galeopterus variegatus]